MIETPQIIDLQMSFSIENEQEKVYFDLDKDCVRDVMQLPFEAVQNLWRMAEDIGVKRVASDKWFSALAMRLMLAKRMGLENAKLVMIDDECK